ncbi:hypothetical protein BGZ57DRAFT_390916 [Hyaloscypha finlandica]|nr:hypothetical protein BGZ57DRAFT_390916 [Hyaloscypha finlandica]
MESMQELQQSSTRDSETMDLGRESISYREEHLAEGGSARTKTIQTKGLFNFMDLPAEIRVHIYDLLLTFPGVIDISSQKPDSSTANNSYPPIAILRTCKKVNEETTPILYGKNAFTISNDPNPTFLLSKFRWTTLRALNSLTFTSNNGPVPSPPIVGTESPFSEPGFHCTGADILARFTLSDFRYSPVGPDHFMALNISNWVSTKVLGAQLNAIQRELEVMMGPYDDVLAALGGPVT